MIDPNQVNNSYADSKPKLGSIKTYWCLVSGIRENFLFPQSPSTKPSTLCFPAIKERRRQERTNRLNLETVPFHRRDYVDRTQAQGDFAIRKTICLIYTSVYIYIT